ncbi:MAG: small ribosomal subunit Rsm22 family protein, partial [Deltaproteobacteria bacterium]
SKERLRILDIGSGPGTAILGIMDFFSADEKRPVLEFTAIDQVTENLRDAEALFGAFRERVPLVATLKTFKSSIEMVSSFPKGPYDIIVLSNILNEVAHLDEDRTSKRVAILKTIIRDLLASDGSCIIIEPALRQTSRDMLEVRDSLLHEGFCIYSPCLMGEKCPALVNPKDWCHEDIPWEFPEIVREVDRLTGLRKDSLKFSHLVIRKDGLSIKDIYDERSFRVVSEPLVSKGKMEFYLCGAGGRRMATRLDKDKGIKNELFEELKRGDIVGLNGVIDEGKRLKVGKDTYVVISR